MSDKEFMDMKLLVRKMIEGEIQINKPLVITTKDRTSTEELSFLSHVLKYNEVTKETIFVFLNETLEVFNTQILKLTRNSNIQNFIDNLKNEWCDVSDILFMELFSQDKVELIENLIENVNELCRNFKEITLKVESNNITDIVEEDEIVEKMDVFLSSVDEFKTKSGEIRGDLNGYEENLNKINMGVLLDLSMKNKSLYLKSGDGTGNIPDNIHNIFLNYIFILNLMKKHIIYYKKTIDNVENIATNMEKHTVDTKVSVKKFDPLFMNQEQEKGIEDYLSKLSL